MIAEERVRMLRRGYADIMEILGQPFDDSDLRNISDVRLIDAVCSFIEEERGPRTLSCQHMSIGNVISASCGICGTLKAA